MQPETTPLRGREWALLGVILLLAAGVRLAVPGITEFKRDEANLSQLALDMAHGRGVPLLGISASVGFPNPPVSVYLFSIPYLFDSTPIFATLFVGVLNVIAVGLTWALARRYYGPLAAVLAGVLYAASPWAAIYARKIWAQDLLPPFVVAVVFTALLGYGEGRRWARWIHWPLLMITVQIHYGAVSLLPLSLIAAALWWRRTYWRDLALAAILAGLTLAPFVTGAYRDGWLALDTVRESLDSGSASHELSTKALEYARLTIAGRDIHSLAGPEQFRAYLASVPDVYTLFDLVPLAALCAALGLLIWSVRGRSIRRRPDVILVAWLALPVVIFTWEWTEVAPHYMIPLMPAAFVLCGAGVSMAGSALESLNARRIMWGISTALVVVIAGLQVLLFVQLLRFVDTHATPHGFGTPLHNLLNVRDAILARAPSEVIVVSREEIAPIDREPAVWGVLLDPVSKVRFVKGTQTVIQPAGESLELIAVSDDLLTCQQQTCQETGSAAERFAMRPGESPYLVRPLDTTSLEASLTAIAPVRFDNGAILTGYRIDAGQVVLAWALSGPVPADFQFFVHALDESGARLAQVDRFGWPGRYWREGDRLFLWFDLAVPPDAATLYTGMYTSGDGVTFTNAAVVDEQGAYVGQGAEVPLSR